MLLKFLLGIKWYIFKLVKLIQLVQSEYIQADFSCVTIVIDH
jgi:hypothetical protein